MLATVDDIEAPGWKTGLMMRSPWWRAGSGRDWAIIATGRPEISLLVRRSIARPCELAFLPVPHPAPGFPDPAGTGRGHPVGRGRVLPGRLGARRPAHHPSWRVPPHAHRALPTAARPAARPPLVTMAPPPPAMSTPPPLPATTPTRSPSAAGVLSAKADELTWRGPFLSPAVLDHTGKESAPE